MIFTLSLKMLWKTKKQQLPGESVENYGCQVNNITTIEHYSDIYYVFVSR